MTDLAKLIKDPAYLQKITEHVCRELRGRYAGLMGLPPDPNLILKVVARSNGQKLILEIEADLGLPVPEAPSGFCTNPAHEEPCPLPCEACAQDCPPEPRPSGPDFAEPGRGSPE